MAQFQAKVNNGEQLHFEEQNGKLLMNGEEQTPDISVDASGRMHVLWNDKSYNCELVATDATKKEFAIRINGNDYTVEMKDQYDLLLEKLGMSNLTEQKVADIKAPMPGLVLSIKVKPGQEIQKGDAVLILEAMKMENVLKASGEGIVKAIKVNQGDAVEKGQIMVTLE